MCMYGGDRVLVPTPALIALAVRGRSGFLFRWIIVPRWVLYKIVPDIQGVCGETSPTSRLVFVTRAAHDPQ